MCLYLFLSPERYDMEIVLYADNSYSPQQVTEMTEQLEGISQGLKDGDQNLNINFDQINSESQQTDVNAGYQTRLNMTFYLDSSFLYLCSEDAYNNLSGLEDVTLADLSSLGNSKNLEQDRYRVNDNPLFASMGEEDLYLVACDVSMVDEGNLGKYQEAMDLFARIVAAENNES